MTKKIMIVCVGGLRQSNGTGLETSDDAMIQLNPPDMRSVVLDALGTLANDAAGLETQELDSQGLGTGLPKKIMQQIDDAIDLQQVNSISEMKSLLRSDAKDVVVKIGIVGNDVPVNEAEGTILDELADEGVTIYSSHDYHGALDIVQNELSDDVTNIETPVADDNISDKEPEMDLGALVGEPGAVSEPDTGDEFS